MKRSVEAGRIVSALTKNEESIAGAQALPKKCKDPGIFLVPCTIGECTFVDAMLDLGASINVIPTPKLWCLEPTGMTIQLTNRSIIQPLGVLEDVLVQVNELIFPADFYVLDMEDETSKKGSTLILGRPFLMTDKTKIDVHVGTLLMEFGDTLVQFNIFEAMKHSIEDHWPFKACCAEIYALNFFVIKLHVDSTLIFVIVLAFPSLSKSNPFRLRCHLDRIRINFGSTRLSLITSPKPKKPWYNLNLKEQRSFGIVFGVRVIKCGGDTRKQSKSSVSKGLKKKRTKQVRENKKKNEKAAKAISCKVTDLPKVQKEFSRDDLSPS
ncbi:hypothetical protein CR513_15180, partial [Mucuna pruriens]